MFVCLKGLIRVPRDHWDLPPASATNIRVEWVSVELEQLTTFRVVLSSTSDVAGSQNMNLHAGRCERIPGTGARKIADADQKQSESSYPRNIRATAELARRLRGWLTVSAKD